MRRVSVGGRRAVAAGPTSRARAAVGLEEGRAADHWTAIWPSQACGTTPRFGSVEEAGNGGGELVRAGEAETELFGLGRLSTGAAARDDESTEASRPSPSASRSAPRLGLDHGRVRRADGVGAMVVLVHVHLVPGRRSVPSAT